VSLAASGDDILVAVRDPNDKLKYIMIDAQ